MNDTVTANTQQAQQQIAQLAQSLNQGATPPTITPQLQPDVAQAHMIDLLTRDPRLDPANQPVVTPAVDPGPAKAGLAAFLASVQNTAIGAIFANQVTQAAQTVLGLLESLVGMSPTNDCATPSNSSPPKNSCTPVLRPP